MSHIKRGEVYWSNGFYEIPLIRRNLNAKGAWNHNPDEPPRYAWAYFFIQSAFYELPEINFKIVKDLGSCHYESVYKEKYRVKTGKDWAMFWDFIFTGKKPVFD